MSAHVPRLRFFVLNLIGAVVWATAFTYIGYLLGEASKFFIADFKRYGRYVFLFLVLTGLVIWLVTLIRSRRKARERGLK